MRCSTLGQSAFDKQENHYIFSLLDSSTADKGQIHSHTGNSFTARIARPTHLWGMSRPTSIQADSQTKPSAPLRSSREPGPRAAATAGSASMAPAEPRYIPEVVRDTARARSCGGTHCAHSDCYCCALHTPHIPPSLLHSSTPFTSIDYLL